MDATFAREYTSSEIYQNYLPTAEVNLLKLNVQGNYLGLFVNTESINKQFLEKHFNEKNGVLFNLYKIKTMKKVDGVDVSITSSNDIRITKSGKFFRDTKIDELPQFWNVLLGDMSFVGPRPDVEGYADKLQGDDRIILSIRPGITGPASIKYKNEEDVLSQQNNPQEYNDAAIWPDKVKINIEYIKNWSLRTDIEYIIKTITG
jgi:lipopolysaccharide/colanic/teichoic acid biosynthesis glycosyltransferase